MGMGTEYFGVFFLLQNGVALDYVWNFINYLIDCYWYNEYISDLSSEKVFCVWNFNWEKL